MTDVVGGLRARFIHDSLTEVVQAGLAGRGWLDAVRRHQPFIFLHGPHTWEVPVQFNAVVITSQLVDSAEIELGSNLSTDTVLVAIDFYAETDSLGFEVANEIRDLLRGRLEGGADLEVFPIFDYREATPSPIGYASVRNASVERSFDQVPEEWTRHVWSVTVVIEDTYY